MHQEAGDLVAFSYDYDRLLDTVWQRTSYIARATKTPDQKNDIREKSMSKDDEILFHDLIYIAAGNAYKPLIKYGREIKTAFSVNMDGENVKKLSWNFNMAYGITASFKDVSGSMKKGTVTFTKAGQFTDVAVTYDVTLKYDYTVKMVTNLTDKRTSTKTVTIDRTSTQGNKAYDFALDYDCDTTNNGIGAESMVSYDNIEIIGIKATKSSPETIAKNTWVEYTDRAGHSYTFQVKKACDENADFESQFVNERPTLLDDYTNTVAYEVRIDNLDLNMVPVIDSTLFDALVCESVLRWVELANPAYMQTALLAQQRSADALDLAVFNAVPHIHRIKQRYI